MTPILTLVRAAWSQRAILVAATTVLSIIVHVGSRDEAPGRLVLGLGVLPAFAAMLGAALGQGEHARWAWALARPVSRARWCITHVAMDVATLGLSLAIAWSILPSTFLVGITNVFEPEAWCAPVIVSVYLCTAIGALRGQNAIRGLLGQLGLLAVVVVVAMGLQRLYVELSWGRFHRSFGHSQMVEVWTAIRLVAEMSAVPISVIGALVHLWVRSLGALPQRLGRWAVVSILGVWAVVPALLSMLVTSSVWWVLAGESVWAVGDAGLDLRRAGEAGDSFLIDNRGEFSRHACATHDHRDFAEDDYRLCRGRPILVGEETRRVHWGELRTCIDIRLESGEMLVVESSAFESTAPTFTTDRRSNWFRYPGRVASPRPR